MNSTSSKVFLVIVMKCENRSHAGKIASLLRGFPHREYGQTDAPSIRFMTMVKADSLASIQTATPSGFAEIVRDNFPRFHA